MVFSFVGSSEGRVFMPLEVVMSNLALISGLGIGF